MLTLYACDAPTDNRRLQGIEATLFIGGKRAAPSLLASHVGRDHSQCNLPFGHVCFHDERLPGRFQIPAGAKYRQAAGFKHGKRLIETGGAVIERVIIGERHNVYIVTKKMSWGLTYMPPMHP